MKLLFPATPSPEMSSSSPSPISVTISITYPLAQVKNLRSELLFVTVLDFSYKTGHVGSDAKTDSKSSHFSPPLSLHFFLSGLWPSPPSCLPVYSFPPTIHYPLSSHNVLLKMCIFSRHSSI